MKKLFTVLAIALFTIGLQAQDTQHQLLKKIKLKKNLAAKKQLTKKTKNVALKNKQNTF